MSEFIAIIFDDADQAAAALGSVRSLEAEDKLHLKDTAVITKDADGKVSIKNEASSGTETGAVVGGILGAMLFLIFPLAGLVGGAAVGGVDRPGGVAGRRRRLRQGGRRRPAGRGLGAVPAHQGRGHRTAHRGDAPL